MTFVTLNDDQARMIDAATSPIVLVDPKGRELGKVSPTFVDTLGPDATEDQVVAEIKRRMATHDGTFRLYSDLVKDLRERFPDEPLHGHSAELGQRTACRVDAT